jgi:hypothetical protein
MSNDSHLSRKFATLRKQRIIFTPSEDMYQELEALSADLNKPMAAMIREAVAEYLKKHGKDVGAQLAWGGNRRTDAPENKNEE